MARFAYRMQSILDLKLKTEGQARMEFGSAQFALNQEIEALNALIARKESYIEEGRRMREEGGVPVRDIIANDDYTSRMDGLIEEQRINVRKAEEVVDRARQKLNQEMQERKMQERLRERAFEDWMEEEKRNEAKEVDERSSFVYGQTGST